MAKLSKLNPLAATVGAVLLRLHCLHPLPTQRKTRLRLLT
jgi:hypothetical protein